MYVTVKMTVCFWGALIVLLQGVQIVMSGLSMRKNAGVTNVITSKPTSTNKTIVGDDNDV